MRSEGKRLLELYLTYLLASTSLPCRTKWSLREIEPSSDGKYTLLYDTPEGVREIKARSVALTVPAYIAADLVRRESPDAASLLKDIDYPPVAAVSLAYPKSSLLQSRLDGSGDLPGTTPHASPSAPAFIDNAVLLQRFDQCSSSLICSPSLVSRKFSCILLVSERYAKNMLFLRGICLVLAFSGFGQLHPRTQGIVTLGTIYSSSLFPNRAPEGYQNLLCYIGGVTNRTIENKSNEEIVEQVCAQIT